MWKMLVVRCPKLEETLSCLEKKQLGKPELRFHGSEALPLCAKAHVQLNTGLVKRQVGPICFCPNFTQWCAAASLH